MPIYEYFCNECNNTSALFLHSPNKIPKETICDHCYNPSAKRRFSVPAFVSNGDSFMNLPDPDKVPLQIKDKTGKVVKTL